jgi:hypothetical protein
MRFGERAATLQLMRGVRWQCFSVELTLRLLTVACLSSITFLPLSAQDPGAALLRWPGRDRLRLRFEIVDSLTSVSGSASSLPLMKNGLTRVVALFPSRCDTVPPQADSCVGVLDESLVAALSLDSGRTYRTTPNLSNLDTTIVAIDSSGTWAPVRDGARTSAGSTVDALTDLALVRLPADSVRVGDDWPVEVTHTRQTASFGEIRTFFSGRLRVDSLKAGRAWLTLEGHDSTASTGDEPLVGTVHSIIVWNTETGGVQEAVTSERTKGLRSGTTIRTERRVRRLPVPAGSKPAS